MSAFMEMDSIFSIAHRLEKFKVVNPSEVYNFRCNVCGDSKKSEHKARGYFIKSNKDDIFVMKCHNCGVAYSFQYYLKLYFPDEYKALRVRIFKASGKPQHNKQPKQKEYKVEDIFDKEYQETLNTMLTLSNDARLLIPVNELYPGHIAYDYLKGRNMSERAFNRLYYTPDFAEFINSVVPSKLLENKKIPNDERIVLVLQTIEGEIMGFQGRALGDSKLRYMTLMMSETYPKIFGLELIDKESSEPIFVTEGAFDSFFIDNCISLNGGDTNALNDIVNYENINKDRIIIILDNEPRNVDTVKRTENAINFGFKVIIWEGINPEYKDINDMIKNSVFESEESLQRYLLNNAHSGTTALLKLKFWSKI